MPASCPRGKIRRVAFNRKAYSRKSYRRSSGTRVRASYVNRSHVPSTCVPDIGAPGKTPASKRILPKPGKEVSLSRFGYGTHRAAQARHQALEKASRAHGGLKVLRRMILLSNFQAHPAAKRTMREDVQFMRKYYAGEQRRQGRMIGSRRSQRRSRRSRKSRASRKSRKSRRSKK